MHGKHSIKFVSSSLYENFVTHYTDYINSTDILTMLIIPREPTQRFYDEFHVYLPRSIIL
jgi:hypothetical protein